jgi:cysteine synthase A
MKIYPSIEALVGNTPLVEIKNIEKEYNLKARLLVKLESFNPAGSAKDRVAKAIIDKAESDGLLKPGGVIIEPTSGNTGIGIAAIAAARGYRAVIVMPETMSEERKLLIKAYGAELVLTEGASGMTGAIEKAKEIKEATPGSIIAGQFTNPENPTAHERSTGPEIYRDTDGEVDVFIAGIGTGGTITGVGRYLKSKKKSVKIVGAEPHDSPVLTGGSAGPHKIQGIGAGFVPQIFDRSVVDTIETVTTEEAFEAAAVLRSYEGILAGISSGAALSVAIKEARKDENTGKVIVVLLPDTGERYLTSGLF